MFSSAKHLPRSPGSRLPLQTLMPASTVALTLRATPPLFMRADAEIVFTEDELEEEDEALEVVLVEDELADRGALAKATELPAIAMATAMDTTGSKRFMGMKGKK